MKPGLFPQAAFQALNSCLAASIQNARGDPGLGFGDNEAFDILIDGRHCSTALHTLTGAARHCCGGKEQHVVNTTSALEPSRGLAPAEAALKPTIVRLQLH